MTCESERSNCCMIEKIQPKGVILSDLIAIFVMSVASSFIFLSNKKITEFATDKIPSNILLLRCLILFLFYSVADLR